MWFLQHLWNPSLIPATMSTPRPKPPSWLMETSVTARLLPLPIFATDTSFSIMQVKELEMHTTVWLLVLKSLWCSDFLLLSHSAQAILLLHDAFCTWVFTSHYSESSHPSLDVPTKGHLLRQAFSSPHHTTSRALLLLLSTTTPIDYLPSTNHSPGLFDWFICLLLYHVSSQLDSQLCEERDWCLAGIVVSYLTSTLPLTWG